MYIINDSDTSITGTMYLKAKQVQCLCHQQSCYKQCRYKQCRYNVNEVKKTDTKNAVTGKCID